MGWIDFEYLNRSFRYDPGADVLLYYVERGPLDTGWRMVWKQEYSEVITVCRVWQRLKHQYAGLTFQEFFDATRK